MSSREQFEAYLSVNLPHLSVERYVPLTYVSDGDYKAPLTQQHWEIWEASRENLLVPLPQKATAGQGWNECAQESEYARASGFNRAIREMESLLIGHGLKVKP